MDLRGADLSYADMWGARLDMARLNKANLSHADLRNALLDNSVLDNANLSHADLRNARFAYARLDNANLSHANLSGARLDMARLNKANLSYANVSFRSGMRADFRNADLIGARGLNAHNLGGSSWGNTRCPDGSMNLQDDGRRLGQWPCLGDQAIPLA